MDNRPLISPLADDAFAIALANGPGWTNQFLVGPENARLQHVITEFFAAPANPYNPLVLFGPPGLGKSHLAHGIARRCTENQVTAPVVCESGADFARGYGEAVDTRSMSAWRDERRGAALFVLDDLDQIAHKSAAQIEFLHTIDALLDAGSRVIVTAQQAPQRIPHLLPGLASRLTAGLVLQLAKPDASVRRLALLQMAAARQIVIDRDAAQLLAERLPVTLAELAGALHTLSADTLASAQSPIDRSRVQSYLTERPAARQATLRAIASHTARHYELAVADLRGPSRRQNIASARAVAMFLARRLTDKSLGAVGEYFGGRDHTTVLHGCRKTEELMARDPDLRQSIQELQSSLDSV